MGVGISLHNLAGHVAKSGGIGVISCAEIGFREPDFLKNTLGANLRALSKEIAHARQIAPKGILGVNIMVALSNYKEIVQKAVEEKIDIIFSGAGLPLDLPAFVKNTATKIAPIVSSSRAANIICHYWDKKYQYLPDCIVIEGPKAGGHLGFSREELTNPPELLDIFTEVKEAIKPYESKYNRTIPLIVGGGIYSTEDILNALNKGADGVQMATRFVTTYECDAPEAFKQAYIDCTAEDIAVIDSPVGMPGRAILNELMLNKPGNSSCLCHCLKKCSITDIPYCIAKALTSAANGQINKALLFCGSNAYKATKLEHVSDIFSSLSK